MPGISSITTSHIESRSQASTQPTLEDTPISPLHLNQEPPQLQGSHQSQVVNIQGQSEHEEVNSEALLDADDETLFDTSYLETTNTPSAAFQSLLHGPSNPEDRLEDYQTRYQNYLNEEKPIR